MPNRPGIPYDKIQLRKVTTTFPDIFQEGFTGVSATDSERGWWPDPPITSETGTAQVNAWIRSGPFLYFVGGFDTVGGVTRNNGACMDLRDGTVTDWDPDFDVAPKALATDNINIYVGGAFTTVGGTAHQFFARVDLKLGTLDEAWDPDPNAAVCDIIIIGTDIYAVGSFTTVNGGTGRVNGAKFTTANDTVLAAFDIDTNVAQVNEISLDSVNSIIYLAGSFTTIDGGTTRNRAAAWDIVGDALITTFDPDMNSIGNAVEVIDPNNIVYGGTFTTVNGATAALRLAIFNAAGTLQSPDFLINSDVNDLGIDAERENIFVVGSFTSVLSITRNRLAKIVVSDNTLDSWDPDASTVVNSAFVFQNTVYVGGQFTTIGGAAAVAVKAINDVLFDDVNTIWVSKLNGDDANAGTEAAPLKTITKVEETTFDLLTDSSASGFDLIEVGTIPKLTAKHVAKPAMGNFSAGSFSLTNYLNLPAGFNTAWSGLTDFSTEGFIRVRSPLPAASVIWGYRDGAGGGNLSNLFVTSAGAISFTLDNTVLITAAGLVDPDTDYYLAVSFESGATNGKKILLGTTPESLMVVAETTQTNTIGTVSATRIGITESLSSPFFGYLNCLFFSNIARGTDFPNMDIDANVIAAYEFETDPLNDGFDYIVIDDSEIYSERFEDVFPFKGLYAAPGELPTFKVERGPKVGTYGARPNGRVKFSTGAVGTFYHVSKVGDDSTGARGDATLPFKTIQAALDDGSRLADDTVQIEDSQTYSEIVNVGALDVTIQAISGETPVIEFPGLGNTTDDLISGTSGTAIRLYGLFVRGPAILFSTGRLVDTDDDLEIFDCTLIGGTLAIDIIAAGTNTVIIENCIFKRSIAGIQIISYTVTMKNCTFGDIVAINTGGNDLTIDFCDFSADQQNSLLLGSATRDAVSSITNSTFPTRGVDTIIQGSLSSLYQGSTVFIENCKFSSSLTSVTNKDDLVISSCQSIDSLTHGFSAGAGASGSQAMVKNCFAAGATLDGFIAAAVSAAKTFCLNNASINSGANGFDFDDGAGTFDVEGCIEKGSATNSFATSGSVTIDFCVYDTSVSGGISATNSFNEDPLMISTVTGTENVALSANSKGIMNGNSVDLRNAGLWGYIITIRSPGATVSGFKFISEDNSFGGIFLPSLVGRKTVSFCTFNTTSQLAIAAGLDSLVKNCLVEDVSGIGIQTLWTNATVKFNAVSKAKSSGIIAGFVNNIIQNNTVSDSEFGQLDFDDSIADFQKNNIYSQSGIEDYTGINEQAFSDIPILSVNASVDSNSTRKDPLHRDRSAADLRLQTIEAGFFFNSPAKAAGDDSNDMGAYPFSYGDGVDTTILVNFSTTDYINPEHVDESFFHVRLVEDDLESVAARSVSIGVKRRWIFRWADVSQMPDAQRNDLLALYQLVDSEIEVSFDGGDTFITVLLMRADDFEFNDIDGLYRDSGLDAPLKRMVLREQ